MTDHFKADRRDFLKQAVGTLGAATQVANWSSPAIAQTTSGNETQSVTKKDLEYPRQFKGRQLRLISFPLGGVAAASIGLGVRGQLRNWEIFNRPNIGFRPRYAFPSIWAQVDNANPVARAPRVPLPVPLSGPRRPG